MLPLRRWLAWVVLDRRIHPTRRRTRRGPPRSPEYRRWIRSFPCAVCGALVRIEAAHTGMHGISQKSSDFQCLPLCVWDHREGPYALHRIGPEQFEQYYQVSLAGLVAEFQQLWRMR